MAQNFRNEVAQNLRNSQHSSDTTAWSLKLARFRTIAKNHLRVDSWTVAAGYPRTPCFSVHSWKSPILWTVSLTAEADLLPKFVTRFLRDWRLLV